MEKKIYKIILILFILITMGIKGLWTILTPYCEKKSLHELRGEKVAVDLSGWVCDSQNVADYHVQPKLYLRNLFFRTCYLLLADILPVFVLEGEAPALKHDVMAARNAIQFRGAAPRSDSARLRKPDTSRKRFKNVLRECELLLLSMGVCCTKGQGEAEAMCAHLNAEGIVDGVVSQDSDCFAYGAQRVYRNFSVGGAAGGGALQGSVDCYELSLIKEKDFGRNKMIALALLCGCDYGVGAAGSCISTATSFLHDQTEEGIIDRLISWVSEPEKFSALSCWLNVPGRCSQCGHTGRMAAHTRAGCGQCQTNKGCQAGEYKERRARVKCELSLRDRALSADFPFPDPLVMYEFLHSREVTPPGFRVTWCRPDLIKFVNIMTKKLGWSERYCVEKFLPLLTRWQLQGDSSAKDLVLEPDFITKKRNPRGVPSYEVIWRDPHGHYDGLVTDDQIEDCANPTDIWTTVERQDLMMEKYPEVVEKYEASKRKPVKEKKTRQKKATKTDENGKPIAEKPKRKYTKKNKNVDKENNAIGSAERLKAFTEMEDLSSSIQKLCVDGKNGVDSNEKHESKKLEVSVSVKSLKRKAKRNQKTLDSFMQKKKRENSVLKDSGNSLKDESKFNFTNDEIRESDLSDIVEKMVSQEPRKVKNVKLKNNFVKLVFGKDVNSSTPKKRVAHKILGKIRNFSTPVTNSGRNSFVQSPLARENARLSYFFDKITNESDAFELSLDLKNAPDNEMVDLVNDSDTMEYSFDHNEVTRGIVASVDENVR